MKKKRTLDVAIRVGADMLKSGAEIFRVEQTIYLICNAYGMDRTDVYAIPSSIIATVENNGNYHTKTKRVFKREINLDRLAKLNDLSRFICSVKPQYSVIVQKLKEIDEANTPIRPIIPILLIGVVGFGFTIYFGGTILEALLAAPIGMSMRFVYYMLEKRGTNFIFLNIISSFISAFLVRLLEWFSIISNPDLMTIGILMALVPGIAVTNGMRDLIAGDFMAALHRLIEALLIAAGIALGTSIAIALFSLM